MSFHRPSFREIMLLVQQFQQFSAVSKIILIQLSTEKIIRNCQNLILGKKRNIDVEGIYKATQKLLISRKQLKRKACFSFWEAFNGVPY